MFDDDWNGAARVLGEDKSSDLAVIDAAGNLTIAGRSKDLIKSGGEWINPAEIEAIEVYPGAATTPAEFSATASRGLPFSPTSCGVTT